MQRSSSSTSVITTEKTDDQASTPTQNVRILEIYYHVYLSLNVDFALHPSSSNWQSSFVGLRLLLECILEKIEDDSYATKTNILPNASPNPGLRRHVFRRR